MPRYVALLRGVSPMNAKMPELRRAFEEGGFTNVRTLLSSGNVAFDARAASDTTIARKAEKAMLRALGHSFYTIVRPTSELQALIEEDPFSAFKLPKNAKRVVTFLGEPVKASLKVPLEKDGATILAVRKREILSAYVPSPKAASFMVLIEKTFGKNVTTRTWETVMKCARA